MAKVAIIGASAHSERTGRLWQYLERHGHQILLAADSIEQTHHAIERLEAESIVLDAVFVADMPSSDSTQSPERTIAASFHTMHGCPRVFSIAKEEDRTSARLTWYDMYIGITDSETAMRTMERSLGLVTTDSRERVLA